MPDILILVIDWLVLVVCLAICCLVFYIWRRVGGAGRMILFIAMVYQTVVKSLTLVHDYGDANIPTPQLPLVFYLLLLLSFARLSAEIRQAYKHLPKQRKKRD